MELSDKQIEASRKLCLTLDGLNSLTEVNNRIEELGEFVGMYKIGLEVYTGFGPEVVREVQGHGVDVFLDLKYHDIPNTVEGAVMKATKLGVYMLNVHAAGGKEMMQAAMEGAKEGAREYGERIPKVIGVTLLTSIDEPTLNRELKVHGSPQNYVLHLAQLTADAGLDGIVCSATDLQHLKGQLPEGFLYVTPGIKGPNTAAGDDQARVATPAYAIENGASFLVVGRAITNQPNPRLRKQAAYDVLKDMASRL